MNKLKTANKTLVHQLKPYWKIVSAIEDKYWREISALERRMNKELHTKDLEIFHCEGVPVGIGNERRTLKLIHAEELLK